MSKIILTLLSCIVTFNVMAQEKIVHIIRKSKCSRVSK